MESKDIIKALECCSMLMCGDCSYQHKQYNCCDYLKTDAVNLIKNQQAEIKVLKSDYTTTKQDYEHCKSVLEDKQKIVEKLNQKLINAYKLFEKVKTEAFKEFADRLCEGRVSNDNTVILVKCLLKELTERKED